MDLLEELKKLSSKEKVATYQRFFKTGKGHYGEGDIFLGITVPETRRVARQFIHISPDEIEKHLRSKYHEERLAALMILVDNYQKKRSKEIVRFYLKNLRYANNWDLVDLTADKILGSYLFDKNKSILYKLLKSSNLWERRIAIVSTFHFIKNNEFSDTLRISKLLLNDKHDLIHKAVGWMLREVGKRDEKTLESFLKAHYKIMPRTALRYAIERFPEEKRLRYLKGKI